MALEIEGPRHHRWWRWTDAGAHADPITGQDIGRIAPQSDTDPFRRCFGPQPADAHPLQCQVGSVRKYFGPRHLARYRCRTDLALQDGMAGIEGALRGGVKSQRRDRSSDGNGPKPWQPPGANQR
jgi:hypothetical protein